MEIPEKRRAFFLFAVLGAVAITQAQDRSDWQSLAQLHSGANVRLTLKSGSSEGVFQNWTAQQVTVGAVTARKEDVVKIELYRQGHGMVRGKKALIGALIGFGGGFGVGAAVRGDCQPGHSFGPCLSRGEFGAVGGAAGAAIGGVIVTHATLASPGCPLNFHPAVAWNYRKHPQQSVPVY